ncbi:MAG: alpha/beta hydrolase-fold protein [Pirellulaceae bacterium]
MMRRFARSRFGRSALVWLAILALVLPAPVQGETVKLKNGIVLDGGYGVIASLKADALKNAPPAAAGLKQIGLVDDDLRRVFFGINQLAAAPTATAKGGFERIKIPQRTAESAPKEIVTVGPIVRISDFDDRGRRIFTMLGPNGNLDIIQGITEITPNWTQLEALQRHDNIDSYKWKTKIATSSIPRATLSKILYNYIDVKNSDDRLRIVKLYVQANRNKEAREELAQIIKEFPALAILKDREQELLQTAAQRILKEIELRRAAGQPELAYSMLKSFPGEGVAGETLLKVRDMIAEMDAQVAQGGSVIKLMKENFDAIKDEKIKAELVPVCEEVAAELSIHTLDRMADFIRLSTDPALKPEQKLSLAISGWLLGNGSGIDNLAVTRSLYQVRNLVRAYLASRLPAERDAALEKLKALEGSSPQFIAKLIAHMKPPLDPTAKADGGPIAVLGDPKELLGLKDKDPVKDAIKAIDGKKDGKEVAKPKAPVIPGREAKEPAPVEAAELVKPASLEKKQPRVGTKPAAKKPLAEKPAAVKPAAEKPAEADAAEAETKCDPKEPAQDEDLVLGKKEEKKPKTDIPGAAEFGGKAPIPGVKGKKEEKPAPKAEEAPAKEPGKDPAEKPAPEQPAEGDQPKPPMLGNTGIPGLFQLEAKGPSEHPDIKYLVQLPPEYNPYRRYPVVVTLNGAGTSPSQQIDWWAGSYDKQAGTRYGQAFRHGYIVVAPLWQKEFQRKYEFSAGEHAAVLNPLRDVFKRFAVDTDKVFLSGHSMGGDAAWDIGLAHPDLWAGVIPIVAEAGKFIVRYPNNGALLPMYFICGERDGNKWAPNAVEWDRYLRHADATKWDVMIVQYQGRGHESYHDEIQNLFEWMQLPSHRRDFFPKEFGGEPNDLFKNYQSLRTWDNFFWYVEFSGMPVKSIVHPVEWTGEKSPGGSVLLTRGYYGADNDGNGVVRVSCGASKVTVLLAPEMVDFSKKVTVYINTKKVPGTIAPNLVHLLEDARTRGDRQHPFWLRVSMRGE